jgi:phosphate transport system substrate-binding protein
VNGLSGGCRGQIVNKNPRNQPSDTTFMICSLSLHRQIVAFVRLAAARDSAQVARCVNAGWRRRAVHMGKRRNGPVASRVGAAAVALVLGLGLIGNVIAQDATVAPYTPGEGVVDLSGSLEADGSSTVGPVTEAVAEEFAKIAGDVEVTVNISGTGGGFKRFCAGEIDLANASRKIKDEEAQVCAEAGIDFYVFEVAYDGITVVTNKANTWLHCMNWEALKLLWRETDPVSHWSDLNPDFPGDTINLYGPGTDSGTYDYFNEKLFGKDDAGATITGRTDYTPSEDDNVLVEGVAGDENGLAYFGYAYYANNEESLNAIAVDGGNGCVTPSTETIRDLSYPFARPLYVYVTAESLTRPEVQEFMRFYLASAQALVEDVGYVDSPVDVYVSDQAKLEAAIAGNGTPDSQAAE